MKDRGVFIAHCPQSNTNLSSGIAPVRRYLEEGLHIGLGTDIAGGHSLSMLRAIADAIQVSNFAGGLWMIPKNLFHWKKPFIWLPWVAVHFRKSRDFRGRL